VFIVLHKILLHINQPNEQIGHMYFIHNILVISGEMENVHDIEWITSEDVRSGYRWKNGALKEVLEYNCVKGVTGFKYFTTGSGGFLLGLYWWMIGFRTR